MRSDGVVPQDRGSGIGDQRKKSNISDFKFQIANLEAEKSDACAKWSFAVREANGAAILGRADGALAAYCDNLKTSPRRRGERGDRGES